ncbi:MAG: hypothetical protein WC956_01860 [bacterium]
MRKSEGPEDFGCPKADVFAYIPEGVYEAVYVGYDGPVAVFGPNERRLYLHWEIVTHGPYLGTRLFQSFKHYYKWGPQSNYYQCWSLAAGRRPRARTRMSPEVFKGKVFLAEVVTVKPVFNEGVYKGRPRPTHEWYSRVSDLLDVAAGAGSLPSAGSNQLPVTSKEKQATSNEGLGKGP